MRNDPKVIAAYLGVEDEEVETVEARLAEMEAQPMSAGNGGAPLLSVRGVKTYYGKIIALRGVDIDVHAGQIVALIGANGAGKSTLMMTICGNPRAREGSIRFDGEDITHLPTHEIMARSIAQAPEGRRIFPRMTRAGEPADGGGGHEVRHFRRGSRARLSRCSRA